MGSRDQETLEEKVNKFLLSDPCPCRSRLAGPERSRMKCIILRIESLNVNSLKCDRPSSPELRRPRIYYLASPQHLSHHPSNACRFVVVRVLGCRRPSCHPHIDISHNHRCIDYHHIHRRYYRAYSVRGIRDIPSLCSSYRYPGTRNCFELYQELAMRLFRRL